MGLRPPHKHTKTEESKKMPDSGVYQTTDLRGPADDEETRVRAAKAAEVEAEARRIKAQLVAEENEVEPWGEIAPKLWQVAAIYAVPVLVVAAGIVAALRWRKRRASRRG